MVRLGKQFFTRDVLMVAEDLLGTHLVRVRPDGAVLRFLVTEVEAYKGREDLACHASKGRTPRTEIMFSRGGFAYVYLIYGMYWMLNVVAGPANEPQAVLIRGLKGCKGPGRLTRLLQIDKSFNGEDFLTSPRIWFESGAKPSSIKKSPRINVDYAGEYWANVPWRFEAG